MRGSIGSDRDQMAEVLYAYWEKYIANRKLYRLYSSRYEKEIKGHGLDPRRDPYKDQVDQLKKILDLLIWLNETGCEEADGWGKLEVMDTKNIVRVRLNHLERDYIDLIPNLKLIEKQKRKMVEDGDAMVRIMIKITDDLLRIRPELPAYLSFEDLENMNTWCKERKEDKVKILAVKGSSSSLEDAFFLPETEDEGEDYPSPFGTFEHFMRVIDIKGLDPYKKWLESDPNNYPKDEELFTVRASNPVTLDEIEF